MALKQVEDNRYGVTEEIFCCSPRLVCDRVVTGIDEWTIELTKDNKETNIITSKKWMTR